MKKITFNKSFLGRDAQNWSEELWENLLETISKTKSKKEIKQLFEKLISKDEKNMILKRLAVIALIKSGNSYQKISEILWLSPNTISAIKKNVFENHTSYKSYRNFYKDRNNKIAKGKQEVSFSEEFLRLIDLAGIIFEPFLAKGLGVTRDAIKNQTKK